MSLKIWWWGGGNSIYNGAQNDHIQILDAKIGVLTVENPIEFGQDLAPTEDELLDCSNIGVFPDLRIGSLEILYVISGLSWTGSFKRDRKNHGNVHFHPFDHQEDLRVEPLILKVNPASHFRMQPCRFEREGILRPLK